MDLAWDNSAQAKATLIALLHENLEAVRAICRRHGVARLEVFGSATNPEVFDPKDSDIDFIVAFLPGADLGPWLAKYFQLRDDLQRLLKRSVELVVDAAMQNPFSFGKRTGRDR